MSIAISGIEQVVAHATKHQDTGTDEISVAALSGELADRQLSKAGSSVLGWTDEKLLKGAGAGVAPDEINVPLTGVFAHIELTGVTADQHHAILHAIDSALVHSGVITDTQHGVRTLANAHAHAALSGIGPNDHHSAVKAIWAQPHLAGGTGSVLSSAYGDYASSVAVFDQANNFMWSIPIPTGFNTLTKAVIIIIPLATGNLCLLVETMFATVGEQYNTNTGNIAEATPAVVAGQMFEYNIAAALAGIAAGDRLGIYLQRRAHTAPDTSEGSAYILGVLLEYT